MSTTPIDWASVASPTFTATSCASSFDIISSRSRSSTTSTLSLQAATDDDEIVWGVDSASEGSDGSQSSSSQASDDEDFVLLRTSRATADPATPSAAASRALPPASSSAMSTADADAFAADFASLSMKKRKTRRGKRAGAAARARVSGAATPESEISSAPSSPPASPHSRKQKRFPVAPSGGAAPVMGLGARPIVEDVSDIASERADDVLYEDAAKFITSYLSNPSKDRVSSLTLLQSLIIELGLAPGELPDSLTSARNVLKANAFLNIREYLAVRGEGPDAVQRVMHPSRSALIRDIRKKRNPANLRAVKESGLNVLLVTCYH